MRILLDAQISPRRVAEPLRKRSHDVLAVDEHRTLDGTSDEALLELAAAERRVLLTFDVEDFAPLARQWAESARVHSGIVIAVGVRNNDFGVILDGLEVLFDQHPAEHDWESRTAFLARSPEP